jgi:AraC family transcriptional regulator
MAGQTQASGLAGSIRGFLWSTEFLVFSDFLQADPHAHSALQLSVGLDGESRVQLDGMWRHARGVLIDSGTVHAFDCAGAMTAIGWVEVESHAGRRLREEVLAGRPHVALGPGECERLGGAISAADVVDMSCAVAHARWRDSLRVLVPGLRDEPEVDERIRAVLDHLRRVPSPPPSVAALAGLVHLSESRLQHVFREQVGVPIRRYLLWHRYLTAMSHMADGATATTAAHAAGFADSAHFTRTAKSMNGFTPTKMPFGRWLTNCR